MNLILWRHADAADDNPALEDLERALTSKGHKQARRMADWLNRQLPAGTRVLVSPAVRAMQTAEHLDRKFKTVAELAPGQGVEALLHATRWPDARDSVLVVGHQPQLGLVAAYLLAGAVEAWPIRKAGIWWLRRRERHSALQVVLHGAMSPDLI